MSEGLGDRMAEFNELPEHQVPSYFRHGEFGSWQLAHTLLMVLAWTVLMPLAIFLSVAKSRYHVPAQAVFHVMNGLGVFSGIVYNRATPDLYANNSHHPLGWVLTGFSVFWTVISIVVALSRESQSKPSKPPQLSEENVTQHIQRHWSSYEEEIGARDRRDSGQGTERNSASLMGSRQNSCDHVYQKPEQDDELELLDGREIEHHGFLRNNKVHKYLSKTIRRFSSKRVSKALRWIQVVFEKTLLPLGFTALLSGFIVAGGLFRERQIFSGLAHYIKGGIFFWYGLLTLGRWMGAFAEFGWAWNIRPQPPLVATWKSRIPSAEFTESFVIWLYGATNVFLEHLNNWGSGWTPSDLEHLSITILFFGGGLLGMVLESAWAQELLNTSVREQKSRDPRALHTIHPCSMYGLQEQSNALWEEPRTYRVPLNPMPGVTIMLLGMMMGAHHQDSMVSTMMHAQWGALFTAFALARAVTYITIYIKPPTSHYPSRPPSEIVAAFCLVGGGLVFMNSSADTVWAIESNGLDAMTVFTLTMGMTGLALAWEMVLFAIKGWAIGMDRSAVGRPLA